MASPERAVRTHKRRHRLRPGPIWLERRIVEGNHVLLLFPAQRRGQNGLAAKRHGKNVSAPSSKVT